LNIILPLIVAAGILGCALATLLGLAAGWFPILELFNHFRPFILAGTIGLLVLALFTKRRSLIVLSTLLALGNLGLFLYALQGAAASAPAGSERFLRVVAFNLWIGNEHMDRVADFLRETDADIVSLEEVEPQQVGELTQRLASIYPHRINVGGLLLLSKLPPIDTGHQNGPRNDGWARVPLFLWAKFDKDGNSFDFAGVHTAWPFNPLDQVADTDALVAFAQGRSLLIMAGDFNLTPWSLKLQGLTRRTGLGRTNTFHFTWPMHRLMPLVGIDNIFVSSQFSLVNFVTGPYLGSDHRPIIADIALATPPQ
jgi:endonuclease/exonuclease/phosphatase (EEP) superfamily protein YafD